MAGRSDDLADADSESRLGDGSDLGSRPDPESGTGSCERSLKIESKIERTLNEKRLSGHPAKSIVC